MIINGFRVHISVNPITTGEKSIVYVVTGRSGVSSKGGASTLKDAWREILTIITSACARKSEMERKVS